MIILIHGCFLHFLIVHPTFFPHGLTTSRIVHPPDCPPHKLSTGFVDVGRWWQTVRPPGGPCKAKCWFQLLKKCLQRESNPSSPVYRVSMLTIRPWRIGWVGLIRAFCAAACCVWQSWAHRSLKSLFRSSLLSEPSF